MVLGNIRTILSFHLYICNITARNHSRYFYSELNEWTNQPTNQSTNQPEQIEKHQSMFLNYDPFLTPFILQISYMLCCIFFALGNLANWNIWRITLVFFLSLSRLFGNHRWGSCSEVPLGGWWASLSVCNKGEHLLIPSTAWLSSSICQLLPPRWTEKEINALLEAKAH